MKKSAFLILILYLLNISCANTVVKKEIVYLQIVNNSLTNVNPTQANKRTTKFEIEKVDSLLSYPRPYNFHKSSHQELLKKYKPDNKFESKIVYLDSSELFVQSAIIEHKRFSFPKHGNFNGYITKELIQNYRNVYAEDGGRVKRSIQVFPVNEKGKISNKPLYAFKTFADIIEIYDREGYFVSIQGTCCMGSDTLEVFDLDGNYILSSNHSIKIIKTANEFYFIGILKHEISDSPVFFIQDANENRQYISLSNINIDNLFFKEHYYLKFSDKNEITTHNSKSNLDQYELNSLDDLEIWLPFNQTDTLKIPFKNQKAFGVDYPQIKVSLSNTN